jgi:hypothetical protein
MKMYQGRTRCVGFQCGDIVGVCIAPVTAQVIMTLLCFALEVLMNSFLMDESTRRDISDESLYNTNPSILTSPL